MSKSRDNADNVSGDIGQVTAGTGLSGGGSSGSITLSLDTTSQYVVPTQTGNSGKYLTTNGSTSSWGTVSSYTAPTIGSTTIASGATVTTIAGLTLTTPTVENIKMGQTTTAKSNGTTFLTPTENYRQFFTGTAAHTVCLPSITSSGQSFEIHNSASGTLTVNDFTNSTTIATVLGGQSILATYITGTSWVYRIIGATTATGSGSVVYASSPTLITPNISTIVNTGTLTLPSSTDTLVGRATSDTLTNKSISGSTNTLSNIGNASLTNSSITINGSAVSLGGSVSISSLPSQTGNSGKYLTTDGTNASWGVISGALAQPTEPSSPPDGQIWVDTDGTSPTAVITRWSKAPSAGTTSITGNDDSSIPLYYTAGYEQVFLNGVLLSRGGDYTATSGTGITLSNATVAGDIVEVISPFQITMADTYTQTQANTTFAADKDQYVLAGQIFG